MLIFAVGVASANWMGLFFAAIMAVNIDVAVFKCKRCRTQLFMDSRVISVHGQLWTAYSCASSESVWYLRDDDITDWMKEQLNKGDWIKGKLFCPKCNSRIGSFDFVNASKCSCGLCVLPAIHIVKGKVDCEEDNKRKLIGKKIMPTYTASSLEMHSVHA